MSYEVSEEPDLIDLDLSMGQFNTTQSIEDMKLDKNMVGCGSYKVRSIPMEVNHFWSYF